MARLDDSLELINRARDDRVPVELFERRDLRDRLFDHAELRDRELRLTTIKGSAVSAFRDPYRHDTSAAQRLGRLHPSLRPIARRAVVRLAREHGLARVSAFGSAVRSDFRPDSDVDVLVEPKAGVGIGAGDLIRLQEELEGLFGRDVEVVRAGAVRGSMLERVRREEVVLYGRA